MTVIKVKSVKHVSALMNRKKRGKNIQRRKEDHTDRSNSFEYELRQAIKKVNGGIHND